MTERAQEIAHWLNSARAGSDDALGQALEACRGYLLSIAQKEMDPDLRAKGGASDLVQETFLKAYRHFEHFNGSAEPELLMWLRRLLLNSLVDFHRLYRDAQKRQANREVPLAAGDSSPVNRADIADQGPTPSNVAMEHEKGAALQKALEQLPEDYRTVLLLRYQEEQSFKEIAQRMNRSENAVRKLWARAAERLQEVWEGSK